MISRRTIAVLGLALVVGLVNGVRPARAAILADLIANPTNSITVGDKVFSNFQYTTTGVGMPSAANVNVNPLPTDVLGNFGITITGGFTSNGGVADATLSYDVRITTPGFTFTDIRLAGNPEIQPPNATGTMSVTETVFGLTPPTANPLGQLTILAQGGTPPRLSDALFITPGVYTALRIRKDIFANNLGGGVPVLSFVDQSFSQVPEPTSMALLGVGVACSVVLARRRRGQLA